MIPASSLNHVTPLRSARNDKLAPKAVAEISQAAYSLGIYHVYSSLR
jgi:hypothetical protein